MREVVAPKALVALFILLVEHQVAVESVQEIPVLRQSVAAAEVEVASAQAAEEVRTRTINLLVMEAELVKS